MYLSFQTFDAKPTSLPVDVSASWLVLPYLIVVVTAVARINVTIVLSLGILSALVMGLFMGIHRLQWPALWVPASTVWAIL